jgi:aminocarboxymuconate-semialdehyde decarboxylase
MHIDVHAHVYPTEYLDLLERLGSTETAVARGMGADLTDGEVARRLELMDAAGVDMQLLSASPQLPYFGDAGKAADAARVIDDLYGGLVAAHPDRFAALAAVPLPDIDAALEEAARALDELGFAGVAVTGTVQGRSIADAAFDPFLAELDRRGALLYVHPAGLGAGSPQLRGGLTWPVGAPVEATVAAAQLIAGGVPSRFPRLRILISHLGGALPMLLPRMDRQFRWAVPDAPEAPSVAARRMWYDSVAQGHPGALRFAAETLGADRLALGTDFPYQRDEAYVKAVHLVGEALGDATAEPILAAEGLGLDLAVARDA